MLRETVGHLRDLPRYTQILSSLARYGYHDLLNALNLEILAKPLEWVTLGEEAPPPERSKRLRLLLESLGPTFVKLGQLLSTRPDLLPEPYLSELALLRDQVAPFPYEEVEATLVREFGAPVEQLFAEFDPVPVASASISQVHRARLADGRVVAVKVRRPDIEELVQADLDILKHLAESAERHVSFLRPYGPRSLAREFERGLLRELDLGLERRTMERVREQFRDDPDVWIPQPIRERSCSCVLTMEFAQGLRIDDVNGLREAGIDPCLVAARGARIMIKQIFEHGFFHADAHPGNMRVRRDGVIIPLDHGMYGYLDRATRERIADLLDGLMRQEADVVLRALDDLNVRGVRLDPVSLRRDVSELVASYSDLSLDNLELRFLLGDLFAVIRSHKLRLPPDLVLLIRALVTIESTGRMLNPNFDIATELRPALRRLTVGRYSPRRLFVESARATRDLRQVAMMLPDVLSHSLESIRRGELTLKFDLQHFDSMVRRIVLAANILSMGIVLAGLLVASSLLMTVESQRFTMLGTVGLILAGALAVVLFFTMARRV
ncbi:ABC-1 domain-containing protein [Isosphaera pallida ATCC 43644]|uniref:ABC-1 domain-containing protein n=1 Tax=Isosphaera pallida (strain ATCC 43644 / DSM 9630 / IS1B) TaxID=575540 RepID=E8R652_ISOPI|nr:AarF/ABC1/UbiB kinase family protein [Isosphaera pallida]ADV60747.1 ABC-1 domain-containing protein [Isosphaera pallida ATCC 43644]